MSELYTINEQYHEKKGIFIYVVKLIPKVDQDDFAEIKALAKALDGYYSSFCGVNGFVFKSEEDAEEFGSELVNFFNSETMSSDKEDEEKGQINVSSKSNSSEVTICPSKMELHGALRHIIQTEGDDIITDLRLVNILDDFKAYENIPASKYILRAIIADGFAQKLLSVGKWNNDAQKLSSRFVATTGFMPEAVENLFKALAYGLGWINKWNQSSETPTSPASQPQPKPKPAGPRSNGWSKKMDEDETDDFFQAITEYDKSSESKFKVKLENLYYYVDDSNLCFSLEIRHNFKDNSNPVLRYAIYNVKGKIILSYFVAYTSKQMANPKPCTECTWKKASNISKIRFFWE